MDAESLSKYEIGAEYSDTCNLFRNLPPGTFNELSEDINSSAFCPLKNNSQLSTDWDKYTTAAECLIRVGLTFKFGSRTYKDQNKFHLCSLNVREIRELGNIEDIKHTPIWEEPPIIGLPNNPSHTDVCYADVELRLKMKGIARYIRNLNRKKIEEIVLLKRDSKIQ